MYTTHPVQPVQSEQHSKEAHHQLHLSTLEDPIRPMKPKLGAFTSPPNRITTSDQNISTKCFLTFACFTVKRNYRSFVKTTHLIYIYTIKTIRNLHYENS